MLMRSGINLGSTMALHATLPGGLFKSAQKPPRTRPWEDSNPRRLSERLREVYGTASPLAPAESDTRVSVEPGPLAAYQAEILACFPDLWPEVEAALSTIATLKLKHAANPVAVVYEGDPASGKSTVVEMFSPAAFITYLSDKFTPASFVSHSSSIDREKLAEVDLLPRIKHKVLLTPELGPTFSGKETELEEKFATLTRVLDGRGLNTDSGVHGHRGYKGDYFFVWLGATTPVAERIWAMMGKMGSRLVMWKMNPTDQVMDDDLVTSYDDSAYLEKLSRAMGASGDYLKAFFEVGEGKKATVRSVVWNTKADPEDVKYGLARLSRLMAEMRSKPQYEPDDEDDEYIPERREGPKRFFSLLCELAQGHALIHGRTQLTEDDLGVPTRITLSSMPVTHSLLLRALINAGGTLDVNQAQVALRVKTKDTARDAMWKLAQHRVAVFDGGRKGHAGSTLTLAPDWQWCLGLKGRF